MVLKGKLKYRRDEQTIEGHEEATKLEENVEGIGL